MARVSFNIATNIARRIVPPPIPPYPIGYGTLVSANGQNDINPGTTAVGEQFFPLGMKLAGEGDYWWLPSEPFISISGGNTIIRRNVAKTGTKYDVRGTVKERWSQDDYRIAINGVINGNIDTEYPEFDVNRLRTYCEAHEALEVSCPLFQYFNIKQIVIENFEFPFTSGENRQAYSISAYSDALFELLVDTESK